MGFGLLLPAMIKALITAIFICIVGLSAAGQQTISIWVTNQNKEPVSASITVNGGATGVATDSAGKTTLQLATGRWTLVATAVGYGPARLSITIPHPTGFINIQLQQEEEELEEVVVQSTRTSRTIANVPTRVETISFEEIDEKNNMRPANVAMLLHESTGIQVQQTSATTGNAGIRIQGLDGRYTQLLKDGFANFGNFSSGLSVLEIPPLDLEQVEIIKGPASPLYGGGAIAGVINFISKTPQRTGSGQLLLNQSNIGQSNAGIFASRRGDKAGYTLLAQYNRSAPYDVDGDDFTEVPRSSDVTIHPRLFVYPDDRTTISLGNSLTVGNRTGGDVVVIKNGANNQHQYFEQNKTLRNITTFELNRQLGEQNRLVAKQSFSLFNRSIYIPAYTFKGVDYNAFTDVAYIAGGPGYDLVLGGNIIYNHFNEQAGSAANRDQTSTTGGLYAQHTWDASNSIKLESGLRVDVARYSNNTFSNSEVFVLPRVSLLVNYGGGWSSRIGAGMGYKTPTLFTQQTESIQYQGIAQLNNIRAEKSYGATADVTFRTDIGSHLLFSFNHLVFFTAISRPLVLTPLAGGFRFINAAQPVHSAGFETNARLIYRHNLKLFLGYTYTHATARYATNLSFLPLVPRHKLNSALIYEKEGNIKIGLEGYFTGRQYLSTGAVTPAFAELGFMAEKIFRRFSLFINFENFTDTRQSRYKSVVNGSHLQPTFDEIWTHTEGFVLNGGIKIRW